MNFKEICKDRYSVRSYLSKEIEKEKIDYILECARLAPSAANRQPWLFYVVTNKEVCEGLHNAYPRDWFAEAPLYIVICKDTAQSWKRTNSDGKDHADIDIAIAAEHLCLAALEQSLGACWVCNFDPQMVRDTLKIEDPSVEPVVIFPIAYIDEANSKHPKRVRKEISEIVKWL